MTTRLTILLSTITIYNSRRLTRTGTDQTASLSSSPVTRLTHIIREPYTRARLVYLSMPFTSYVLIKPARHVRPARLAALLATYDLLEYSLTNLHAENFVLGKSALNSFLLA